MLEIRVLGDVYGLDDASARELVRRVEAASPSEQATTLDKLRDAEDEGIPAELDDGDLALVGVVLEAWFQDTDGDLPADAHELQLAIADYLG